MSLFGSLRDVIGSVAERAVELGLPVTCAGCYRPGTTLCRDCGSALKRRLAAGSGVSCLLLSAPPGQLHRLESCGPFEGMTRRAVERLSVAGERRLSEPLGRAVANCWLNTGTGGDVLVPVPASADRVRHVGYDQAALLARVAGRRLGMRVVEALVRLPSYTPSGADKRFEVIASARIARRSVVLVDDVVASGATLASCAAALLAAGATQVSAVTVARDHSMASQSLAKPLLATG